MIKLAICVLLNGAFWTGAGLLARRPLRRLAPLDRFLAIVVFGHVLIVAALQVMSLASAIDFLTATVFCLGVFVSGLAARRFGSTRVDVCESEKSSAPPGDGTLAIGVSEVAATSIVILALWAAGYYLLRGLLTPVAPVSDAPIYHLPFVVRWWQAGRIDLVATPFGELAATYFPANADLWALWLLVTGCPAVVLKIAQWPFLLLGALAIFRLARQVGCRPTASFVPAAFWMCTPWALLYAPVAIVDGPFAAWYLVALVFLISFLFAPSDDKSKPISLIVSGASAGLALGAKSVGLVYVPCLLVPALAAIARNPATALRYAAMLLGSVTLPSGFWFARNWWITGNPLYPLDVSLCGIHLFDGWYDRRTMLNSGYHQAVGNPIEPILRFANMLDLRVAWLVPVSILAGLAAPWFCHDRNHARVSIATSLLAIAHFGLFWWIIPYNTQERFLLCGLAIGLVPMTRFLDGRALALAAMAALLSWRLFSPSWVWNTTLTATEIVLLDLSPQGDPVSLGQWPFALALPTALFISGLVVHFVRHTSKWLVVAITVIIGGVLAAWPGLSVVRQAVELASFPGVYPPSVFSRQLLPTWIALDRATAKRAGRIAYAGTNLPYYLFGSRLKNDVRYVNISGPPQWLLHDFHRARLHDGKTQLADTPWPQWHREQPDYGQWLNNLRFWEVEYLFVARENLHGQLVRHQGPAPFPIERQWADEHPEVFEPMADANDFLFEPHAEPFAQLYRLRPARDASIRR